MAYFFSCCCGHTPHWKSPFIFHSVDLDIIISLQKQEKKPEHLCLLPICCTSARFVAGLQSSVSNPQTPFIFLLKCLVLYPTLVPLRDRLFFFFFPLLYIKNTVTFNISIFAFNSNEQSLGLLLGKALVNEVI